MENSIQQLIKNLEAQRQLLEYSDAYNVPERMDQLDKQIRELRSKLK